MGKTHTPYCLYYVYADKALVYHYPVSGFDCAAPLLGTPNCSTADVWIKAKKRGPLDGLRTAKLRYTSVRATKKLRKQKWRGTWIFSSGTEVELKLADDCQK